MVATGEVKSFSCSRTFALFPKGGLKKENYRHVKLNINGVTGVDAAQNVYRRRSKSDRKRRCIKRA